MAAKDKANARKIVESHSSMRNNDRLQALLFGIDKASIEACRKMEYPSISEYWIILQQFYINVKDVLHDEVREACKGLIWNYHRLNAKIIGGDRTMTNLNRLLLITQELNAKVITGLQAYQFFFRIGNRSPKGFKHSTFFSQDDNVFRAGKTAKMED